MKIKKIYWGDWHIFGCDICYEMERRGYEAGSMDSEDEYWEDFFAHKLKPVKFRLVKATKKK